MISSYKYRVKDKSARKALAAYAISVNQVWNYCNAYQGDIESRYRAGAPKRRWPTRFDLTALTAGTSKELGIHANTITEVCRLYAASRDKVHHSVRFRSSFGSRRALGWVPFRSDTCRADGNAVIYRGRRFKVFGAKRRPLPAIIKGGSFVEDALGRWWLTIQVEVAERVATGLGEIGIDLGLKSLATMSDGTIIENPRHLTKYAAALAVAQRAGKKRRAAAIHLKIGNVRRDFHHKASRRLVDENRLIVVGDVSSSKLAKTKMAKSVLDAGWSSFREQLRYKSQQAGVVFVVANERWTSQTCSACGTIPDSSPKGVGALGIRQWKCSDCGTDHDRDVNAALNILAVGRSASPRADGSRRAA